MKLKEASKRTKIPLHTLRKMITNLELPEIWEGGFKNSDGKYIQKHLVISEENVLKLCQSSEIEEISDQGDEKPSGEESDTQVGRTGGGEVGKTASSSPCSQGTYRSRRGEGESTLDREDIADPGPAVDPDNDNWILSLKKGRAKAAARSEIPDAEKDGLKKPSEGILTENQFDLWYKAVVDLIDWDRPMIEKKHALRLACQLGGSSIVKLGVTLESLTIPLFVVVSIALIGSSFIRSDWNIWRPPERKDIPAERADPGAAEE